MKKLEELGISPVPWKAGINPHIATILDGYEGKCIYANGDVNNTPYVGFANVVNGDTASAIRNARLIAAAPELYDCLREAIVEHCYNCEHSHDGYHHRVDGEQCQRGGDCLVKEWRKALAKAAGEEENNG